MERLLIPIDFDELVAGVEDDAAKWRLIKAMLCYCRGDSLPAFGPEKMIWNMIKKICDDWMSYCDKQAQNGRQPKSQKKPTEAKKSQKKPDEAKASDTKPTLHNITLHNNALHNNNIEPTALDIAMSEFEAHRKSMKKPLNELSKKKILNELERLSGGNEAIKIQIIDQSIRNGWQGVFALKDRPQRNYEEHPASDLDHLLVNLDE